MATPTRAFCAAGGGHEAAGYDFALPHDVPGTPNAQNAWRYCGKCHGMFFDGYPDKGRCPDEGPRGHVAAGYDFVLPHDVPGTPNAQNAWRYCDKCHGIFFDGYPNKGCCAAGGGHEAAGYEFVLPHDVPGTPNAQNAWRYCDKCHGMFFDGYPDKGVCPIGGGHEAIGYEFVLPYDVPPTESAQNAWRYCERCHGMFFDGYPDKGVCPAWHGHDAIGYEFVLPHGPFLFEGQIVTGGLAALGGWVQVTVYPDGSVR
ncbi:MAG TPA: hypothetical protein VN253_17395 [Kofleriaceae bacterium]|nr:hypothetical protein [Kofleriaceae bacterium]